VKTEKSLFSKPVKAMIDTKIVKKTLQNDV
jgi:hypothetical protein